MWTRHNVLKIMASLSPAIVSKRFCCVRFTKVAQNRTTIHSAFLLQLYFVERPIGTNVQYQCDLPTGDW